jgi:serine/tyrosine/threonine adenylyltransferase
MFPTFRSRFVTQLPGEVEVKPGSRQVNGSLWSPVQATAVSNPRIVAHSKEVAGLLHLSEREMNSAEFTQVLSGNKTAPGTHSFAANYGGHQFGNWAGQLGDGRAISLGELPSQNSFLELQLKGAGPTPYSRRADGRAVMRSSIREFLCSEAMFHLGIPTTRALSLISTGDSVVRDMFYDGHPENEPGAIVCRVAPSFIRFGNFELCAARDDLNLLKKLTDFTIDNFYPELALNQVGTNRYRALFSEVSNRTAKLIAHWQSVGFVHGVMNTDNMSILGLTIDYGPYGFLDDFDFDFTPNTTDAQMRRYVYGNQPNIGLWNISRLGMALAPLLEADESYLEEQLAEFKVVFEREFSQIFARKLGLTASPQVDQLLGTLFEFLSAESIDMTLFFRHLSKLTSRAEFKKFPDELLECFYGPPSGEHLKNGLNWLNRWRHLIGQSGADFTAISNEMNRVNPLFILRNYLAQEAIDLANAGDFTRIDQLLEAARFPFDENKVPAPFCAKRPAWALNKAGCSALSCSS